MDLILSGLKFRGILLRSSGIVPSVFTSNYVFPEGESVSEGPIQILPNVNVEIPPGSVWNLQPE